MKRYFFCLFGFLAIFLIKGCAAPGSTIGHLKVQGSLVSTENQPLPNRDIEFVLPATYGLGGLDLALNGPVVFGNKNQKFIVTTDVNGKFESDLGSRVFHVNCWLLPPIGCYPWRPPAPFLLARFPDNKNEFYAIQSHDGKFKVYSLSGHEIPLNDSLIDSISASNRAGRGSKNRETIGVIKLRVKSE